MSHRSSFTRSLLFACFTAASAVAQTHVAANDPGGLAGGRPELAPLLDRWRAAHGPNWELAIDAETGHLQMLYGGHAAPHSVPRSDAEFAMLATERINETLALHGIEIESLVQDQVVTLPLGMVGSTDKVTVRYRQNVNGLDVVDGFVNVLFNAAGDLLSMQSTGLPHALGLDLRAPVGEGRALSVARRAFGDETGLEPTFVGEAKLVIAQVRRASERVGHVAWQVETRWELADTMPEGRRYWIDAKNGAVLKSENTVHNFDVFGTVTTRATPGVLPDTGTNPETNQPTKYLRVQSSAGTVFTDANGNFNYPGVNSPLSVTVTYVGTYNNVSNNAVGGVNYTLTQTVNPNTPTTLLMNPGAVDTITSQANAFQCVNILRDWLRSVNPLDAHADFVARAKTNEADTCNAFYNGNSLNFFAAGAGCVNTAYSTVASHEHGHWMNDQYQTGNGADGMGEGNADVWSMYIWDNPIIGQNFAGTGNNIGTGTNTLAYCGDGNGGCYGEPHGDGQVWMGAAWKIRSRLNTSLGNAAGDAVANSLFLAWMNAYNQGTISSIIETQWLTLDDNDGNIHSGTPHYPEIDGGFRDNSFPGFVPLPITFSNVTDAMDTTSESGPYGINAMLSANQTGPLTSVTLRYRVNGGSFSDVVMSPYAGILYQGLIPGQLAHAHVEYYVVATDSGAHTATYPPYAPGQLLEFDVAIVHPLAFYNFDGGTDQGWTHGTIGDTSNAEDDWSRQIPIGKGGTSGSIVWTDPPIASSANRCWGNDLGIQGNNGAYGANVHNFLRSPAINCTGAVGTKLRFKRWLTVQGSANDQARILVNGSQVYINPATDLVDSGWTNVELDISAIADGNPAVQVEWRLHSNATTQPGGWAIDDVNLLWTELPPCSTGESYCFTSSNSFDRNGAVMSSTGSTLISNDDLVLVCSGVPPGTSGFFFYGRNPATIPFGSGYRCVAEPFFRRPTVLANGSGVATSAIHYAGLPAAGVISAGETWRFQFYYLDPPGGPGSNTSDGLALRFCP